MIRLTDLSEMDQGRLRDYVRDRLSEAGPADPPVDWARDGRPEDFIISAATGGGPAGLQESVLWALCDILYEASRSPQPDDPLYSRLLSRLLFTIEEVRQYEDDWGQSCDTPRFVPHLVELVRKGQGYRGKPDTDVHDLFAHILLALAGLQEEDTILNPWHKWLFASELGRYHDTVFAGLRRADLDSAISAKVLQRITELAQRQALDLTAALEGLLWNVPEGEEATVLDAISEFCCRLVHDRRASWQEAVTAADIEEHQKNHLLEACEVPVVEAHQVFAQYGVSGAEDQFDWALPEAAT